MQTSRSFLALVLSAAALSSCGTTVATSAQTSDGVAPLTGTSSQAVAPPAPGTGPSAVDGPRAATSSPGERISSDPAGRPLPVQASAAARGGTRATAIPPTGRGWDRTRVWIGITTEKDVNTAASSLGIQSLDAGDQEGQARAAIAAINKAGGLFGRTVVPAFRDHSTSSLSADADTEGAATCTHFTQDRPVIAVLNPVSLLDRPSFRSCFAKHRLPLLSISVQAIDDRVLRDLGGYVYASVVPTYDRLAPVLAARLQAQRYFTGWNTTTGEPSSSAPVKVGLVVYDDEVGARVEQIMTKALAAVGHRPDATFRYLRSNDLSSAVLRFRQAGVTHVLGTDAKTLYFLIQADSQGYLPRYGVSSYLAPQAFLESTAPDRQLRGAIGVGFAPSLDVSEAQDPGDTNPGERTCRAVMAAGGQSFSGKRFAEAVGFAFCDGIGLMARAAVAGGGFDGGQLSRGVAAVGPGFPTAFTFASALTGTVRAMPGAARDLRYDTACLCFRYAGGSYRL